MEHAAGGCEQRPVVARGWEGTLHARAAGRKRLLRSPERHGPQSGQDVDRKHRARCQQRRFSVGLRNPALMTYCRRAIRSEEHTSELQSRQYLVCRLLLEKKKNK